MVVKLSKDGSRLTQIISEIKNEFISMPREEGKEVGGDWEKSEGEKTQRIEREALLSRELSTALRRPSRFLLPHTSSIHPSPNFLHLPATLSDTCGVWIPLFLSTIALRRPRPRRFRMKALAATVGTLAAIDNHGDGAVPVGFSPPKLTASFARKHPRRAAPSTPARPSVVYGRVRDHLRRNNSLRFYLDEYH